MSASTAATLTVGIRARPLVRAEIARGGRRDIIRVLDSRIVVVLDPDENKVCGSVGPWAGLRPSLPDALVAKARMSGSTQLAGWEAQDNLFVALLELGMCCGREEGERNAAGLRRVRSHASSKQPDTMRGRMSYP